MIARFVARIGGSIADFGFVVGILLLAAGALAFGWGDSCDPPTPSPQPVGHGAARGAVVRIPADGVDRIYARPFIYADETVDLRVDAAGNTRVTCARAMSCECARPPEDE